MWLHRNAYVHKKGVSIHLHERHALIKTIQEEFLIGRNELPAEYESLFQGRAKDITSKDDDYKMQWITSVWFARDRIRTAQGLELWYRNPAASAFIRRRQQRRKRKRT